MDIRIKLARHTILMNIREFIHNEQYKYEKMAIDCGLDDDEIEEFLDSFKGEIREKLDELDR